MISSELGSTVGEAQGRPAYRSRRSPLEVRMDILKVVRDGAEGPTQIMYRANLSWVLATQHIKELVSTGVLSEHNVKAKKVIYKLTDKGISVLRTYWLVIDKFNLPSLDGSHNENWAQQQDSRIKW